MSDRYKYTGRELEAAAGLYNDRDRVLILSLGRFMTPDRMGFAAGDMDLYRYAGNGFQNGTDPSGDLLYAEGRAAAQDYINWIAKQKGVYDEHFAPYKGEAVSLRAVPVGNDYYQFVMPVGNEDSRKIRAAIPLYAGDSWTQDSLKALDTGYTYNRAIFWEKANSDDPKAKKYSDGQWWNLSMKEWRPPDTSPAPKSTFDIVAEETGKGLDELGSMTVERAKQIAHTAEKAAEFAGKVVDDPRQAALDAVDGIRNAGAAASNALSRAEGNYARPRGSLCEGSGRFRSKCSEHG